MDNQKIIWRKGDVIPIKACAFCRNPFQKRPKDSQKDWESRHYCSNSCSRFARMAKKPLEDSLLEKSMPIPLTGCWIWIGAMNEFGAGKVWTRHHGSITATTASYEIFVGEVPKGMIAISKCGVLGCINPHHLTLGSKKDVAIRTISMGRQAKNSRDNLQKRWKKIVDTA